jgi:tetratricopeptide (TPR) repeat protein
VERVDYLNQAIDAINKALKVRTREHLPHEWAVTQNNLGTAWFNLAQRSEGKQKTVYADRALYAFTSALYITDEVSYPDQWAQTMNDIAHTYILEGEWVSARDAYQSLVQHDPDNLEWVQMLELLNMIVDPAFAK